MDFVALLSVLAITSIQASARPLDTDPKTKGSDDKNNIIFKFPTDLKHGLSVTINGTINTKHQTLTAVFPGASENSQEHCTMVYNIEKNVISVSPIDEDDDKEYPYQLFGDPENISNDVHPKFSIRLEARAAEDVHKLMLTFEGNAQGPAALSTCIINNFDGLQTIVFQEGVHNITSLLFEFM